MVRPPDDGLGAFGRIPTDFNADAAHVKCRDYTTPTDGASGTAPVGPILNSLPDIVILRERKKKEPGKKERG